MPVEVTQVDTGVVKMLSRLGNTEDTRRRDDCDTDSGRLQVGRNRDGERLREGGVVEARQVVARVLGEEARLHARVTATRHSLYVAAAELRRQELSETRLVSQQALQQAEGVFQNALQRCPHGCAASALAIAGCAAGVAYEGSEWSRMHPPVYNDVRCRFAMPATSGTGCGLGPNTRVPCRLVATSAEGTGTPAWRRWHEFLSEEPSAGGRADAPLSDALQPRTQVSCHCGRTCPEPPCCGCPSRGRPRNRSRA